MPKGWVHPSLWDKQEEKKVGSTELGGGHQGAPGDSKCLHSVQIPPLKFSLF